MRVFLKYWLPLLIWLGIIFVDSTDLMSAEHTSRFIVPILLWLKPGMAPETLRSIHFAIRKCAHLTERAMPVRHACCDDGGVLRSGGYRASSRRNRDRQRARSNVRCSSHYRKARARDHEWW